MKDNALRTALRQQAEQTDKRLPSNFAYNTLRRIEREKKTREHKEQVAMACAIVIVTLMGLSALLYYYGEPLLDSLLSMSRQTEALDMLPALTFCAVFLTVTNIILRRKFMPVTQKRQSKSPGSRAASSADTEVISEHI